MDNRDEFEAWYRDNSFEYSAISNGECFYIWQAACASQWRLIAEALERWTCSAPSTGQKKGLGWSVGYPTTGEAEMNRATDIIEWIEEALYCDNKYDMARYVRDLKVSHDALLFAAKLFKNYEKTMNDGDDVKAINSYADASEMITAAIANAEKLK